MEHQPVLLKEVLEAIHPQEADIIVDGTFGRGGYTKAFLDKASCMVYGIDRDPEAIAEGKKLAAENNRFHIIEGNFGEMNTLLKQEGVGQVDAIALDIGVSSPQLDDARRGFSFAKEGPLDMRMSQKGPTAADLVNNLPEEELADIIYAYGEERHSRRIARKIAQVRKEKEITTTKQLAEVIYSVMPKKKGVGIDPATRTFQALRIKVNDEFGELERGLEVAEALLKPGGRLAVVSFHSLEDRCVKRFFKSKSQRKQASYRHLPDLPESEPTFKLMNRKAIVASEEEVARNPRARSAKLRWGIRTEAKIDGGL